MSHPDEVVKPAGEVPSKLVAEAQLRHEQAGEDGATAQEKKQAAVEQAHALSTRPDGSYAQLHEVDEQFGGPKLAVADSGHAEALKSAQADVEQADRDEVAASQKAAEKSGGAISTSAEQEKASAAAASAKSAAQSQPTGGKG